MKVCTRISLIAIPILFLALQAGIAFGGESRPGKFVTIEGQEIGFFQIEGRPIIKGWLNGTAIDIPMDTVSQVVFFDSPDINYSMFGNDISSGNLEVTRKSDGKKFMIKNFKKLLAQIHSKSLKEQKRLLDKHLDDWMKNTKQIDDIIVMGVRV